MSVYSHGKKFSVGGFEIDIIVHCFPGKSVCHGSLDFSTIALIRKDDRLASIDVGEVDVVFSGDRCKNRTDLLSKAADITYDSGLTRATIE